MSITITISGTQYQTQLVRSSLSFKNNINLKTASFQIQQVNGENEPTQSQELIITTNSGTKLFAGYLTAVKKITATVSGRFIYNCQAAGYTETLLKGELVQESISTPTSMSGIVGFIFNKYDSYGIDYTTHVPAGPTIQSIVFPFVHLSEALNRIGKETGYRWYLDNDRKLHMTLQGDESAPVTFEESRNNFRNLTITPDASQLRNRITLRGGKFISNNFSQEIETNGLVREWILREKPKDFISLVENVPASGISYTREVGVDPIDEDTGNEYMFNFQEKFLRLADAMTTSSGTILTVTYKYETPLLVRTSDNVSINLMKTLKGGNGIFDFYIFDKNLKSKTEARDRGQAELDDYSNPLTKGEFKTSTLLIGTETILKPGQTVTLNVPTMGISNIAYEIQEVAWQSIDDNEFDIRVKFGGRLKGMPEFLARINVVGQPIDEAEVLDTINNVDEKLGITETIERDANTQTVSEEMGIAETIVPALKDNFKWSPTTSGFTGKWNSAEWL